MTRWLGGRCGFFSHSLCKCTTGSLIYTSEWPLEHSDVEIYAVTLLLVEEDSMTTSAQLCYWKSQLFFRDSGGETCIKGRHWVLLMEGEGVNQVSVFFLTVSVAAKWGNIFMLNNKKLKLGNPGALPAIFSASLLCVGFTSVREHAL